jgi:hypothetical protein
MQNVAHQQTHQWGFEKQETTDATGAMHLSHRPEIVARDGRYVAFANGVICDCYSGLEWFPGPDKDISWEEGCRWVGDLGVGGGGWRLPYLSELRGLYKMNKKGDNISPLFEINMTDVWSSEIQDETSAWGFNFLPGNKFWTCKTLSRRFRVLAVRPRNYRSSSRTVEKLSD